VPQTGFCDYGVDMKAKKQTWELIRKKNEIKEKDEPLAIFRAETPGGWLVQPADNSRNNSNGWVPDTGRPMFFLPDPNHEWLSPSSDHPDKG